MKTSNFPKIKIYYITFSFLVIYFLFDFFLFKVDKYAQLNYDWKNEKIINVYSDNIVVDSVSYNFLKLRFNNSDSLFVNNTYVFESKNIKYYFKASFVKDNLDSKDFKQVFWIKNRAPKEKEVGRLYAVDLPLIQNGDETINTIGGTMLTYKWANSIRKEVSNISNYIFVGHNSDLFSYPHDAIFKANSTLIAKTIVDTKTADNYILFLGDSDNSLSFGKIEANYNKIFSVLKKRKQTKSIILLLLPPSKKSDISNFRKQYNLLLIKISKKYNIKIIKTDTIIDGTRHLDYSGNYPNSIGYKLIAQEIVKVLDEN